MSSKKQQGSRFFRVIYALLAGVVGFIFRIKVVNPDNEPDEGGFVVCANHISATDPIMLCYAFSKHQVCFMAKKELFKIPILSGFFKLLGAFPIDRGGNDVGAIKNAISIVEEGRCLGVFPQGHRYPRQNPRDTKTKNGAALICAKAQASVVPAYIWHKGNKAGLFRRTYVIIGEKIPFDQLGYNADESGAYTKMTEIIFDKVCALGENFEAEMSAAHAKKNKGKKK